MCVVYYTWLGDRRLFVTYYANEWLEVWYSDYGSNTTESLWIVPNTIPEDEL